MCIWRKISRLGAYRMSSVTQALNHLQTTPLETIEDEIRSGILTDDLQAVYGDALAQELTQMVRSTPGGVLSTDGARVVILPGVTGSTLLSNRGQLGLIWLDLLAIARGRLHQLRLHTDGASDAPGVEIVAGRPLPIYLPLQWHLKYWAHCQVYAFPYDWRHTPAQLAEQLKAFLLRLCPDEDSPPVHLVGHSMGGLVAREFCYRYPDLARVTVRQIIMLGTPNYGSCEPVRQITVGGGLPELAQRLNQANEPIRVARSFPSLYAMLPAPPEAYPEEAPLPYPFVTDAFDYYRESAYRLDAQQGFNPQLLASAKQRYLERPRSALSVPVRIIAGYGLPTCTGVVPQESPDQPILDFATHTNELGDGTVPLAAVTALPGAECYYLRGGGHGALPYLSAVRDAVQSLIGGQRPSLPTTFLESGVLSSQPTTQPDPGPKPPLPGELSDAELAACAERLRSDTATPEDWIALAQFL
ncbi:MAG: alpha/beta fold hydrolase [Candidatus Viridilinea halotolerans]|uniref:Alpha/beta fold hydrolase n=1 Tax=Candidatus Viridilinea halotolerans TaxID=2491704 RepID=A0A426U1H8_9CHLR|nr:MAG: alpha/beta fold hydrolase [Candidatus Viridilinea halotolerans]